LTSLLITRDFVRQVIKSRCQDTDSEFDPLANRIPESGGRKSGA